jgi:hypothetical protein
VIQERVATRKQEAVGLRLLKVEDRLDWLNKVDAQAPGLDHTLVAQPVERTECTRTRFLEASNPLVTPEIACKIVNESDLDAVGT